MLAGNSATLLLLAFGLGLRHGMDPDHLAAIDGLTRHNLRSNPRLSRVVGFLFSLGHGSVVIVVASLVGMLLESGQAPRWTKLFGDCISIGFLFVLGGLNLRAALRSDDGDFKPIGFRSTLFRRMFQVGHPLLVVGIGALFAISFDTISQASLISLSGTGAVGRGYAALLGVSFTLGMMTPDALNGLWIFRLARRADRRAPMASRAVGLTVGLVSVLIGVMELIQLLFPGTGSSLDDFRLWIGFGVVAAVTLGAWLAVRRPRCVTPSGALLEPGERLKLPTGGPKPQDGSRG